MTISYPRAIGFLDKLLHMDHTFFKVLFAMLIGMRMTPIEIANRFAVFVNPGLNYFSISVSSKIDLTGV